MALVLRSPSPPPVRFVQTEFNDDGLADLIIRTTTVDFQVHKWPLRHSSSVFKDMLSFPQPQPHYNPNDVVEVTESAKTIQQILSVIYAHDLSDEECITTINDLSLFAHAALKYDIPPAILRSKSLMRHFLSRRLSPLRIYALALKFGFDYVADRAFRICVCLPLTNPALFEDPELRRDLEMKDYQMLLFSRTQRAEKASEVVCKHYRFAAFCGVCQRHGCGWWDEYVLMVMLRMKERPSSEVLFDKVIIDTCLQHRCVNEMANFADSEPFFMVVKAEVDRLPWEYDVTGKFEFIFYSRTELLIYSEDAFEKLNISDPEMGIYQNFGEAVKAATEGKQYLLAEVEEDEAAEAADDDEVDNQLMLMV